MIACIAPGLSHSMDTYSTLNFATKSKRITNRVTVNEKTHIITQPILPMINTKPSKIGKENQPRKIIPDLPINSFSKASKEFNLKSISELDKMNIEVMK